MPTNSKKPAPKSKPGGEKSGMPREAAVAFMKVEPELEAIKPDDLQPINVDIPRAVAIAVGAVPHIQALRGQIAKELPSVDLRIVDEIGTYALAAWYTHLLMLPATTEQKVAALLDEATPLREHLLIAAEALAHRGFLDEATVKAIREGKGNLDKANDLVALAALFSASWDRVKNKTTVEWPEVERASTLGPALLVALGARDQPGIRAPSPSDPGLRRARAYTLFVRAYDECRRAVTFLRWHEGDVDQIAPSLFAARGGGRKPSAQKEPDEEGAAPPEEPNAEGSGPKET